MKEEKDEGARKMDGKEERGLKGKQGSRKVGLERAGGLRWKEGLKEGASSQMHSGLVAVK